MATKQASMRNADLDNLVKGFSLKNINNHAQRFPAIDCQSEVTYYNSKLDKYPLNINDAVTRTDTFRRKKSVNNGVYKHVEQQHQNGETLNLLLASKKRSSINGTRRVSIRRSSSNLVVSNENPWKKMGRVRYQIDATNAIEEVDPSHYEHIYAQHITYV